MRIYSLECSQIKQRPALKSYYIPSIGALALDFVGIATECLDNSIELFGTATELFYCCSSMREQPHSVTHALCGSHPDPSLTLADYGLDDWQWLAQHRMDLGETCILF